MKSIVFLIQFFAFLSVSYLNEAHCQEWTKLDVNYDNIIRIFIPPSQQGIVAVSSSQIPVSFKSENLEFDIIGSGFQISSDSGRTFGETILDGNYVLAFIESPVNKNNWFVSTSQFMRGRVMLSTDTGISWDEDNLRCDETYHIFRFETLGDSSKFIGAAIKTGRGFISTVDNFNQCKQHEKPDVQARDIKISRANPNLIFIAGDNVYQEGVFRSYDQGETWFKDEKGLERLRIHTVLPSSTNVAMVFCGADTVDEKNSKVIGKGIYRSLDTGKTWEPVLFTGSSVFELMEHPSDPRYIVAACGSSAVWISANGGGFWKQYSSGLPEGASVQTIAVPDWEPTDDGIIAFAGTVEHGLYKSSRMITPVKDDKYSISNIIIKERFPQPASDYIYLTLNVKLLGGLKVKMLDLSGNEIKIASDNIHLSSSNIMIDFDKSLANGLYQLVIYNDILFESVPVMLYR